MPTPKAEEPAPKAKRVQGRKPTPRHFPTDEESVVLRHKAAEKEAARVEETAIDGEFFGAYQVASSQWTQPYDVEIRSLVEPINSCTCQDFMMNRLGTCKHIERVLQTLPKRRKRRFTKAMKHGSPAYEIFFDTRSTPPVLRLLTPQLRSPTIDRALTPLFSTDDTALATPTLALPAIERARADLSPVLRRRVHISAHTAPWIERLTAREQLSSLRRAFEQDVAAGKRSDNPVLLPLYPYQKAGMHHLAFTGRALLADEMGLGKTVQAIAAAEMLRQLGQIERVLIVCPASLKAEWEEQLHYFTGLHARLIYGSRAVRLAAYSEHCPYSVMNYEQVRNDVDAINDLMLPDLVILDEAQRIKNWPTKTAKTIKRLHSRFAFVLTGTPLENRIEELYSLVEFIDPQVFGSLFRFERQFMEWDPENNVTVPVNMEQLHRRASTVMLRRRKADVESCLPKRTDKTFFVQMTDEQTLRYMEYRDKAARLASIAKRRPLRKKEFDMLMQMLACMRMLCDTPHILDPECRDCPKLEELEPILDELLEDPDTKIIIFSEWVRMLDLVMELLDEGSIGYAEHTGRIPQQKRRAQLKRFKSDPECRVFISSDAGGTGLNLQAASVVINLDLPWNPAKLEQRIARAWRKHQQRPVRVINIVSQGTIEEEMLGKLAYKTALADAVLDGAVFDPGSHEERAKQSFVNRVRELVGDDEKPRPERSSMPPEPTTVKEAAEDLQARHPQQILGIEQLANDGPALIIARTQSDSEQLRETLDTHTGDAPPPVEIIDAGALALLRRLSAQGLIQIAPELQATFETDGYQSLAGDPLPPASPPRFLEDAQACWHACGEERAAAEALLGAGLTSPSRPHLLHCIDKAREALHVLHTGLPDAEWPSDAPDQQLHAALDAWRDSLPADASLSSDAATQGLELLEQLQATLV